MLGNKEYSAGETLQLEFHSNGETVKSLTWYFDGEVVSAPSVSLSSGKHEIKLVIEKKDGNEVIVREITVN